MIIALLIWTFIGGFFASMAIASMFLVGGKLKMKSKIAVALVMGPQMWAVVVVAFIFGGLVALMDRHAATKKAEANG